ncbi:MAG TPA: copper resistance CopC family protein [Segeticoccus sp.]|nr:copper resistance CopC family protein [Segeticoccus sp.]
MTSRTLGTPSPTSSTGGRPRLVLLVLAALAALTGLTALQTATAPPAAAHDVLIRTVPADGATVPEPPGAVKLVFEEPPLKLGTEVAVTGPDGAVQQGKPVIDGSTVRQQLTPGTSAGTYTVDYRVTSDDGHVVSGTFSFTAQQAAGGASATSSPAGATSAPASPTTAAPQPSASGGSPTVSGPSSPSSSAPAAADGGSGLDFPVPPSILAWGVVLLVLVIGGITWLVKRLGGRDEQG